MLRALAIRASLGVRAPRNFGVHGRGVVGLSAGENPRKTLTELYKETLDGVSAIPSSAAYRVNVEKTTRYRLNVVQDNEDVAAIESKLGVGPITEVLEQARDELELIPHMVEWQPWNLEGSQVPVKIELID